MLESQQGDPVWQSKSASNNCFWRWWCFIPGVGVSSGILDSQYWDPVSWYWTSLDGSRSCAKIQVWILSPRQRSWTELKETSFVVGAELSLSKLWSSSWHEKSDKFWIWLVVAALSGSGKHCCCGGDTASLLRLQIDVALELGLLLPELRLLLPELRLLLLELRLLRERRLLLLVWWRIQQLAFGRRLRLDCLTYSPTSICEKTPLRLVGLKTKASEWQSPWELKHELANLGRIGEPVGQRWMAIHSPTLSYWIANRCRKGLFPIEHKNKGNSAKKKAKIWRGKEPKEPTNTGRTGKVAAKRQIVLQSNLIRNKQLSYLLHLAILYPVLESKSFHDFLPSCGQLKLVSCFAVLVVEISFENWIGFG